jgi:hypothetical protein
MQSTRLTLKRLDRWSVLGIALIVVGMLIRSALYFPPAMFQIDSDAVLSGLCAFRVAEGQYPMFFPGGTRLSAASCYVAAGYFHLFGPGRIGLALTGLTWAALYLVFMLLFLRATLGRKLACLGMIFAIIPSEQFMTVTYAPWAYGEIIASCAASLWLAALWRSNGILWRQLAFGFSVGFGIWVSMETLMITLPAVAWVAIGRRRLMLAEAPPALFATLVGLMPFLLWNAAHGFPSFTQNWASRPASSFAQAWNNLIWLLTYMLPKLLFRSSGWWSETPVLMAAYGVVAIGFAIAIRQNLKDPDRLYSARDLGALLLLVLTGCALIFSFSEAGSSRGWTVRYIAPLYLVVPLFCAIGIEVLWSRTRTLATMIVAALLIPNLLLYGLPGSSSRAELTDELSNDSRIRQLLTRDHVQMVYGDYFWVYHLNFDTHERTLGIPSAPVVDYLNYGDRLGTSRVRWALLGGRTEVSRLAQAVHARGSLVSDGALWLFIADRPAPNAAALIAALRSSSG